MCRLAEVVHGFTTLRRLCGSDQVVVTLRGRADQTADLTLFCRRCSNLYCMRVPVAATAPTEEAHDATV